MNCPKCGAQGLWRDSANIGVGIIYGPYGCEECRWSEDDEYDCTSGAAKADTVGIRHDQWGVGTPRTEGA